MTEEQAFPQAATPTNEEPQQTPPSVVHLRLPHLRPWMTYTVMGLTIAVFLMQTASDYLLGGDLPAYYGMKINEFIQQGQLWRFITPVLLHGSILHLGFNMYALYAFGPMLESLYGHWKFLWLYLVCNFSGVLLSFILTDSPSLGSSTAIFGLLGANAVFAYVNRRLFGENARHYLRNMISVAAVNLLIGLSPGIDNWGHVGGLLGGAALGFLAGPLYQVQVEDNRARLVNSRDTTRFVISTIGITVVLAVIAAIVIVIRNS